MPTPFAVLYAHAHRFLYADVALDSRDPVAPNHRWCEAAVWCRGRLLWRQCRKTPCARLGTLQLCRVHKEMLERAAAAEAGRKGLRPKAQP